MEPYQPKPIDTESIRLPDELTPLVEKLAEHVHDVWSSSRLAEGWAWGPHRDDQKRLHPDLVPYAELSEVEKNYDRQTALGTLKAVLAFGGQLRADQLKNPASPVLEAGWLPDPLPRDPAELRKLWDARPQGEITADLFARLAQQLLRVGEPILAYDILVEAEKSHAGHLRLSQLMAMALDRSGATGRARQILESLQKAGHCDGETLGLLARTHKAAGLKVSGLAREQAMCRAYEIYAQAYQEARTAGRQEEAYYNGINAASTACMRGDTAAARQCAQEVRRICLELLKQSQQPDYWLQATLAEAALLTGDIARAAEEYRQAAQGSDGRWADLASTRRQARMLLQQMGMKPELAEDWMPIPPVLVYCGHMIDARNRPVSRFPVQRVAQVAAQIGAELDRLKPTQIFGAAASGADLLVIEAALSRGIPVHLVLPFGPEDFRRHSVEVADASWGPRFDAALNRAASVTIATDHCPARMRAVLEYTNRLQLGLASLQAERVDACVQGLAVWDGLGGDGAGGTASSVGLWKSFGIDPVVVPTGEASSATASAAATPSAAVPGPRHAAEQRTVAILFADVAGFSKLDERQLEAFAQKYLGAIAAQADRSLHVPILRNTWGDGLFFVFENVRAAGLFALELCEAVRKIDLKAAGLPHTLGLRVALHVGPVYEMTDPVTQRANYLGTHVSRAARIEPVTPPGQVYASAAFAALSRVAAADAFACDYVGQIPLAKNYGRFAVYHVRPSVAVGDS